MLSLEEFARLRAAIEAGGDRDGALEAARLTTAEWLDLQRHHLAALETDVRNGHSEVGRRYLVAYDDALRSKDRLAEGRGSSEGSSGGSSEPSANRFMASFQIQRSEPRIDLAGLDPDHTLPPIPATSAPLPFRTAVGAARPPNQPLADRSGETVGLTVAAGFSGLGDEDAEVQMLRLDRYVALASQLRMNPGAANEIMTSFGLRTPAQRQRIHSLWKMRFEGNQEMRERFDRNVEEAYATMSAKQGSR